jgi:hypothetical protein
MMSTKNLIDSIETKALIPTYHFVTSTNFIVSLIVVAVMLALIFMYPAIGETSPTGAYVKHQYTQSNGDWYTYGFKICAGNIDLHNAKVVVSSDSQTITVTSDKTINAGKCSKIFGVQIKANDPNSIRTTLIDNTYV